MSSLYQITDDLKGIFSLLENLTDEDGNTREPNQDEKAILSSWFGESESDFEKKFDSYNRFITSLKADAVTCDTERKALKDELDRLSKRAKTALNKVEVLKSNLRFCLERLGLSKFKTALFSANIQNVGGKSYHALEGADLSKIPDEYLKPRELDVSKIKDAVKNGDLILKEDDKNLLNRFKVFTKSGAELEGVRWNQPTAIVLR